MTARDLVRSFAIAGAAIAVGAWSSSGRGRELDEEVFREFNRERGPRADAFFGGITELGSIWASLGGAATLVLAGRRRPAGRALAAAGAAWLAGQGLKKVFGRPRPFLADPDATRRTIAPPRATSWPSSHPAVLLAFTTAAGRELELGSLARASLDALGLAVAASRTYVGVHYPADVVGGVLLGRAIATATSSSPHPARD